MTTCFLVSVVLGLLLAGNSGGALSYVLTAVVIAIVAFFCLFWIGAIVAAVCGMSITGGPKGKPAPEPTAATADAAPARRRRRRRRRKKKRVVEDFSDDDMYERIYDIDNNPYYIPHTTFLERLRERR